MDQETLERKSAAAGQDGLIVDREMMAFETDGGIGTKAALGLLVLETDQTIEDEFRFLLPESGIALYGARLHNDAKITPETLAEMEARVVPTVDSSRRLISASSASPAPRAPSSSVKARSPNVSARPVRRSP